jgi:hypothetical protein
VHDDEEGYILFVDGRKKRVPSFSSPNKIIRISEGLHSWLNSLKIHPDESFNMVLFRLISCHYGNKPIYRIFGNEGCSNCQHLDYVIEKLIQEPLFKQNISIEHQDPDQYPKLKAKYVDTNGYITYPIALLYNHNSDLVSHSTGYVLDDNVRKAFENVISSMPEKIEDESTPAPTPTKKMTKSKKQEPECVDGSCRMYVC